jgi:uncharacterized protein YcfJ
MANPHHRKKHKEHLRQFQKNRIGSTSTVKGKASNIFAVVGAVMGLAIAYFASGNLIWVAVGAVAGGLAGYFTGKNIDNAGKK